MSPGDDVISFRQKEKFMNKTTLLFVRLLSFLKSPARSAAIKLVVT